MKNILQSIRAVSEEVRIRIILLLADDEACVCELMEIFGMAQSLLSHHLITLRDAGFLLAERRGKWNYYRLNPAMRESLNRELMQAISRQLRDDAVIARDRKKLSGMRIRDCNC